MWDFDKHRVETAKIMHTSLQQPEEDFGPDDGAGGGRWMHIYGSDKDTLNKLAAFYHIEDEDVEAAVNPANSGPEVNFRPGATEVTNIPVPPAPCVHESHDHDPMLMT